MDRTWLWFRVLEARYGVEEARLKDRGRDGSAWWREMVRVQNDVRLAMGGWFEDNISWEVRNEESTFFWTDCWLGELSLRDRFRRLFDLSEHKWSSVADMEENLVGDCRILLQNITLQVEHEDQRLWKLDLVGGYTVGGVHTCFLLATLQVMFHRFQIYLALNMFP